MTSIVMDGGVAYLGGNFAKVRNPNGTWVNRTRLAAVDTSTCAVLAWAPSANAEVSALHVVGSTVYIGGTFTSVNSTARNRLAAVDAASGALKSFNPNMNNNVRAITSLGGRLFVGGEFSAAGGVTRKKLAAFDLQGGTLVSAWKPVASGKVTTLTPSPNGGRLYVGGSFTSLAGSSASPYLGAVSPTDGSLDQAFLPKPGWPLYVVAADSRGVYVGGGGSGGHFGIWELNGSKRRVYQTDGGVQAVAVDGDSVYAGGHFTNYCIGDTGSGSPFVCTNPLERRRLFEVSLTTGNLTSWAPKLNSAHGVWATAVEPTTHDLWTGGDFTKVGSSSISRLAVFPE